MSGIRGCRVMQLTEGRKNRFFLPLKKGLKTKSDGRQTDRQTGLFPSNRTHSEENKVHDHYTTSSSSIYMSPQTGNKLFKRAFSPASFSFSSFWTCELMQTMSTCSLISAAAVAAAAVVVQLLNSRTSFHLISFFQSLSPSSPNDQTLSFFFFSRQCW